MGKVVQPGSFCKTFISLSQFFRKPSSRLGLFAQKSCYALTLRKLAFVTQLKCVPPPPPARGTAWGRCICEETMGHVNEECISKVLALLQK